jgi:hypothetical protein
VAEILEQRIGFDFGDSGIAFIVGAIEPLEGLVDLSPVGINL